MKRREFITLLGGAAVGWPLVARAQQAAPPTIGLLDPRSPGTLEDFLRAFRHGKNSPTVGMSGSASERVAVVTASARSLPALINPIDETAVGK